MARVLLERVTKEFPGGVIAARDVSLEIADGEFMVIVGPSGCGKTTTLRLIAGLDEITSGNITIGDVLVNKLPPKDRDIAMVFQNYALYPHMSVYQNMAFGLKLRKYPKAQIKERVTQTARLLGIEHLLDRKPRALSGGQCQRVAVGRAIARRPKVFLFDEPLSNLDAKLRVSTRAELKALHKRLQTTSIYVTHDQAEAMTLGDRICVMCEGIVQQVAPPMEVYDRPVNKFVAGFLGAPSMNFFAGRVRRKDDRLCFTCADHQIVLPARFRNAVEKHLDHPVTLGIRPEHLSLAPYPGQTENEISAFVRVVEPLGDRIDVYFEDKDGTRFIGNLGPQTVLRVDEPVRLHLNVEKLHLFEPAEIGRNILFA